MVQSSLNILVGPGTLLYARLCGMDCGRGPYTRPGLFNEVVLFHLATHDRLEGIPKIISILYIIRVCPFLSVTVSIQS